MLPLELFILLHHQQHQEMEQQAGHARLVQAGQRAPTSLANIFQYLLWWDGDTLLTWGCTLRYAGRSPLVCEKEGCLCP